MIRIDAHHHVWTLARGDYHWLRPEMKIHRDYGLDDLRPLLDGIAGTVLVQAAATEAETLFLLEVASGSGGLVCGVVGWTDLAAPDAADRVAALARHRLLKGLRPMLQDIAEAEWILGEGLRPGIAAMIRHGLRFDALVTPRHLPALLRFAARHPGLPIVVDHGAKPDIRERGWQPWADDIARIARETRAFCKLSGLVTEAEPSWSADSLRRYADHLLDCFGPSRLMWGSDWPVVDLAGGYGAWRVAAETLLARLPEGARAEILGGTAIRFYGLDAKGG